MDVPVVNVGILAEKAVAFVFNDEYVHTETGIFLLGEQRALLVNNKIVFNGRLYDELFFEPSSTSASFDLKAVTIGIDFHWERKEDQRFNGALNLIVNKGTIVAINQVDIEIYLKSVISSEMSASSSKELLKAHAIISRSWLLSQITKNYTTNNRKTDYQTYIQNEEELVRWYDREDHLLFDVCADDHCQRYQGITRAYSPVVEEAVSETAGELLMYNHDICDARFSKCCGGVVEQFETCWEPAHHPYLEAVRDSRDTTVPDLTIEAEACKWIRTSPDSYCNTRDERILTQVLTNYDQETSDFYRWKVTYTQEELSELIRRKSGMDFGLIQELIPVKRGTSGRLEKLKIVGTKKTFTIGKELEIRRTLSESHLYSSAFIIEKEDVKDTISGRFVFAGAGWGHGVGLCQIGAAVMADLGIGHLDILRHYYPGAYIEKRY